MHERNQMIKVNVELLRKRRMDIVSEYHVLGYDCCKILKLPRNLFWQWNLMDVPDGSKFYRETAITILNYRFHTIFNFYQLKLLPNDLFTIVMNFYLDLMEEEMDIWCLCFKTRFSCINICYEIMFHESIDQKAFQIYERLETIREKSLYIRMLQLPRYRDIFFR